MKKTFPSSPWWYLIAACLILLACSSSIYYTVDFQQLRNLNITRYIHFDLSMWEGVGKNECHVLSFSSTPIQVSALASFPGSGNSWMRYLLQKMTGIYTGSVYSDHDLKKHGFPGEGRHDGTVVAVKTHLLYNKTTRKHSDKVLLLIRNPFEALLAEFNRRTTKSHVGQSKLETYIKGTNANKRRRLVQVSKEILGYY